MLGKLIKHDFKQTAHSVIAVYCAALGAMVFMLLSYLTKITWIGVLGSTALVITGGLTIIMTLVAVISNFQRSLYGSQGYLTFALPVNCSKLLTAKVIVSAIWIILSYIAFLATFIVVYFYAKVKTDGFAEGIGGMLGSFEMFAQIPSKALIVKFLIYIAVAMLLNVFTFIGYVYFAVTIANTRPLQKHPLAFGLLIFMAVYAVTQGISAKLTYSLPLSLTVSSESVKLGFVSMDGAYAEGVLFSVGIGGVIFTTVAAIIMLFITGWIMEHKVNIK